MNIILFIISVKYFVTLFQNVHLMTLGQHMNWICKQTLFINVVFSESVWVLRTKNASQNHTGLTKKSNFQTLL